MDPIDRESFEDGSGNARHVQRTSWEESNCEEEGSKSLESDRKRRFEGAKAAARV